MFHRVGKSYIVTITDRITIDDLDHLRFFDLDPALAASIFNNDVAGLYTGQRIYFHTESGSEYELELVEKSMTVWDGDAQKHARIVNWTHHRPDSGRPDRKGREYVHYTGEKLEFYSAAQAAAEPEDLEHTFMRVPTSGVLTNEIQMVVHWDTLWNMLGKIGGSPSISA